MKQDLLVSVEAMADNIGVSDDLLVDCRFVLDKPEAGYLA